MTDGRPRLPERRPPVTESQPDEEFQIFNAPMKDDANRKHDLTTQRSSSQALDSALRLLGRRDHSCRELAFKLRRKGLSSAAVDYALARCREMGVLDDARTAGVFASHLVEKGYGPLRIRQELSQKGIPDDLIDQAMLHCGDETSQTRSAQQALKKRTARLQREPDPRKRRQIAYRYLASRGFTSSVIHQAVADL